MRGKLISGYNIFLFLTPLALLLVLVCVLMSAIQPQALVGGGERLRHADVGRIKYLIKQNDPRQLRDGEVRRLEVTERDLNLMLDYALGQFNGQSSAIDLAPKSVRVDYSYTMPHNPLGKYFDVSVALMQSDGTLKVRQVDLGAATVPGWMLNPVVNVLDGLLRKKLPEYAGVIAAVKDLRLQEDELQVIYQWHSGLADRIHSRGRDFLLPQADRQRIVAYYELIAEQSKQLSGNTSMAALLQPLFALAAQRSNKTGNESAENRALFLALGLVVNRSSPDRLLGSGGHQVHVRPEHLRLTLADRAGVALANIALGPEAKQVQRGMAASLHEADFMPSTGELSEGLMELEFKSRYVDLDSARYQRVDREIADRISRCTIHL